LPASTITETAYLLAREGGNHHVANFLDKLPNTKFEIVTVSEGLHQRTSQLLRQYSDSRLDYVDATLVAVAEHMNVTQILTLDHRDFRIVRPQHCDYFELLPPKS
jgi:predicted nucleic acid-binding protein